MAFDEGGREAFIQASVETLEVIEGVFTVVASDCIHVTECTEFWGCNPLITAKVGAV